MPYVCAPGRGQVDGQCSALREKEEAPSCTCSLQQLRAPPLSVTHPLSVTTWTGIPRWRAIRAVATIVVHCATPSPPMPVSCQELFLEERVSIAIHYLIRCARLPTSQISLRLGSVSKTRKDRRWRCDGNGFSCLSIAYDRRSYRVAIHAAGFLTIVWKNFDRCRRMRFIPFDILWRKLLQMWF